MEKQNVLQINTDVMNVVNEQMLIASKIRDILEQYPKCFAILKSEFFPESTYNQPVKDSHENMRLRLYAEIISSDFKKKQAFAQAAQKEVGKNIKRDAV